MGGCGVCVCGGGSSDLLSRSRGSPAPFPNHKDRNSRILWENASE